jgi:hypothetical protein
VRNTPAASWLRIAAFPAIALCGCAGPPPGQVPDDADVTAAWVVVGQDNQAYARVNTRAVRCPPIVVDGEPRPMILRAPAETIAPRTRNDGRLDAKPTVFATNTCESPLPSSARRATVASRSLPLPTAEPRRIVILGDTGCRMQASVHGFQACNDASAWPFPVIASAAAALKPDLVIHVGDYHYREHACPEGEEGCRGSPWGYGSDAWEADLFKPAATLLASAPWVVVRGNHEECARAGQGWFRYLDPNAYRPERSCNDPALDEGADYTEPYALPLGSSARLIVFDSSRTGLSALKAGDPQFAKYQQQFRAVTRLAEKSGAPSIFVSHHPVLGFVRYPGAASPAGYGVALRSVMETLHPGRYFPPQVTLAVHGHVHNFQAIAFASDHPSTLVVGNGGDQLDASLPDPFPLDLRPAPSARLQNLTHTSRFGFLLMERSNEEWSYRLYTPEGSLMGTCRDTSAKLACSLR